ncbi:MAG: MarR family winged helix-turn-helix transcriptional regulator [Alphaproteobacteria bacterium]
MKNLVKETEAQPVGRSKAREDFTEERVAHLTRLCARGFNRSLTRRLVEHGISFGQWVFLRILWNEQGLTQRDLAERANLTEPTVHTALVGMEQQGLINRFTKKGNRRKHHVFLTEHGKSLRAVLEPLAIEANDVALRGLDAEQRNVLRDTLIKVLENLEQDEVEAFARGQRMPPTRGSFT